MEKVINLSITIVNGNRLKLLALLVFLCSFTIVPLVVWFDWKIGLEFMQNDDVNIALLMSYCVMLKISTTFMLSLSFLILFGERIRFLVKLAEQCDKIGEHILWGSRK